MKRFIDLHLQLPEPSRAAFSRHLVDSFHIEDIQNINQNDDWFHGQGNLANTFSRFSDMLDLSLRDQEQAFSVVNLILRSVHEKQSLLVEATVGLSLLGMFNPELYYDSIQANDERKKLRDFLELKVTKIQADHSNFDHMDFVAKVVAWFIDGNLEQRIHVTRKRLSDEFNQHSADGVKSNRRKEIEVELQYLDTLLRIYGGYSKGLGYLSGSIAELVHERLSKALILIQR